MKVIEEKGEKYFLTIQKEKDYIVKITDGEFLWMYKGDIKSKNSDFNDLVLKSFTEDIEKIKYCIINEREKIIMKLKYPMNVIGGEYNLLQLEFKLLENSKNGMIELLQQMNNENKNLIEQNKKLTKLASERTEAINLSVKLLKEKEDLEYQITSNFTNILNEKKRKIRELEEKEIPFTPITPKTPFDLEDLLDH